MSLQLAFGSFGDFVTLIQITKKLAEVIRDAMATRHDIQQFATFLNSYSTTMSTLKDTLDKMPKDILPPTVLRSIEDAVAEASRLMVNFMIYMNKFRSESWWGGFVIEHLRWALVGKEELVALKEGLISQQETIQTRLGIANL